MILYDAVIINMRLYALIESCTTTQKKKAKFKQMLQVNTVTGLMDTKTA